MIQSWVRTRIILLRRRRIIPSIYHFWLPFPPHSSHLQFAFVRGENAENIEMQIIIIIIIRQRIEEDRRQVEE